MQQNDKLRECILRASYSAGACHVGSALSSVEIIEAILHVKKAKDVFVHSKASGIATWYCKEYGVEKTVELLKKYPLPSKETGLSFSSGSLGHGLSFGTGIAYANRKIKVYCLLSDGEMQEGQVWEAVMFSAHHKLKNLFLLIDNNKIQALDWVSKILNIEPLDDKFTAFGWCVWRVDGHNQKQIEEALKHKCELPKAIICDTKKGKGVSFLENSIHSHYHNLTKDELEKSLLEINTGISKEG